jgi:hypothetical protein
MSLQTRDLYCQICGTVLEDVSCEYRLYPACPECGGPMKVTWESGQPPNTDIHGVAEFSDATGMYHTSQRDKVRVMKECGYEEAGDKVHGGRPDHTLKNSTFSYPGQRNKRTTAEGR